MEAEHGFTLVIDGVPDLTSEVVNALFEAGCDDATPVMTGGRLYMGFDRSATTLGEAISSAIEDVRKADIGAKVIRVDEVVPGSGSAEKAYLTAGAINGVLQAAILMEDDPTFRPIVLKTLGMSPVS
jgi:hypothetical protein